MSDRISKQHRSWNMSRIRGKDTGIEVSVRKALFARGFRYRKNDKRLPGKPDIVLPKYKCAIFVNGCFWHMHAGCPNARLPKSNVEFWKNKLEKNAQKDKLNTQLLESDGWRVINVWECELDSDFEGVICHLISLINQ